MIPAMIPASRRNQQALRKEPIRPLLRFAGYHSNTIPDGQRVLIVTGTWGKINGVATTAAETYKRLKDRGYEVEVFHPGQFPKLPSFYPGQDCAIPFQMKQKIEAFKPNRVFILTEDPLGWTVRNYCLRHDIPFTTNYTTQWPEYMKAFLGIPPHLTYQLLQKFHNSAQTVLVTTQSMLDSLAQKGFKNLKLWSPAVNTDLYKPMTDKQRTDYRKQQPLPEAYQALHSQNSKPPKTFADLKSPFFLYVGRVSKEKNIEAFLQADLPGTKLVVGPAGVGINLEEMQQHYPDAVFLGPKKSGSQELADVYAASDVFVFPSKTDTLGLVMLEALSSGIPVASFNITGPKDVIEPGCKVGYLAETSDQNPDLERKNLELKARQAWTELQQGRITREDCRQYVLPFSWDACVSKLLDNLKIHQWLDPKPGSRKQSGLERRLRIGLNTRLREWTRKKAG
ncbi:MAG TPA: glycosyltransferase family 1 protein [Coleofasciculaceae cyanobacterium]